MDSVSLRRKLLLGLAAISAVFTWTYGYIHTLWHGGAPHSNLSVAECANDVRAAKDNPHKMLFISCGGFLE